MSVTIDFKPASSATIALLDKLGIAERPTSQTHASRLIYAEQARLANRMPTEKQKAAVFAIGINKDTNERMTSWTGRDLPGVRHREISFQIELLNLLAKLDTAQTQSEVNTAAVELIETVRTRLTKASKTAAYQDHVVTPEDAPM